MRHNDDNNQNVPTEGTNKRAGSGCPSLLQFQISNSLLDSVHLAVLDPQNEVHHHCCKKRNGQDCRAESVIDAALPAAPDTLCPPMECDEGIYHGAHSDDGEEGGGDATDTVTEVEEADGETAQDDGKVEP